MNWKFQGTLTLKGERYIFRTDHGFGPEIWAWKIHDPDYFRRSQTYKFERVPKGAIIELFDLEQPPETVGYIPILK